MATIASQAVPTKPLAFVEVETTGLTPERHEIVELAVLRVDARSMVVVAEHETLVAPERLPDAQPEALSLCGFSDAAWAHATPLRDALLAVRPLLEGTLVAGHNIGFAWSFLEAGFRHVGLELPHVDTHRLDTASLAWPLVTGGELGSLSLDGLARHFRLSRPTPHRALTDARLALEVARRLGDRTHLGGRFSSLAGDERELCDALLGRLERGRVQYGPWNLEDGRDYPAETLDELLDGMQYLAAEIVRRQRQARSRHRRIYVCHPFSDDPDRHLPRVLSISRRLVARGVLPVTPQLYLPQLLEDVTDPARAKALRLELVETCDEVRVFSSQVTAEMAQDLAHAHRRRIPVAFEPEVLA